MEKLDHGKRSFLFLFFSLRFFLAPAKRETEEMKVTCKTVTGASFDVAAEPSTSVRWLLLLERGGKRRGRGRERERESV